MNNISVCYPKDLENIRFEIPDIDYSDVFSVKTATGSYLFTIRNEEGEVITFAGLDPIRGGVMEAWIVRTSLIPENKKIFHESIKWLIDITMEKLDLHRMQMTVISNSERNKKWAEKLGFESEGILRNYDPGEDYIMYSRLA